MTRRGVAAILVTLFCGVAALWWGAEGFAAFTAETARRLDVARSPRALPAVALEDHQGAGARLADFAGKVILLDFVFTRCPTLCVALGTALEQARARIAGSPLDGRVVIVTISFDPEHDGPAELAAYADRFGGADATWRFMRAPSTRDTRLLLRAAAVTVVPDPFGGFVHNAAILVVGPDGRLIRVLDSEAVDEALATARRLLGAT